MIGCLPQFRIDTQKNVREKTIRDAFILHIYFHTHTIGLGD